jgi:predicted nucleotide-binding protein (sugar kinase/HSP70/actin superfamily)
MTKAVIPEAPPLLEIDIDINKGKRKLYRAVYSLGSKIKRNPLKVREAGEAAWQAYLDYRETMSKNRLTPPEVLSGSGVIGRIKHERSSPDASSFRGSVALVGHPYLIYDEYINHRLVKRLQESGNRVLTPEMVSPGELKEAVKRVSGGAYWTYEEEVAGAGGYYMDNGADGVIGIMAFGCGPDSLMMDMVRRYSAEVKSTPFMCLTLEEHTAEAGVVTRLEAFTDMIYRRKERNAEVCV